MTKNTLIRIHSLAPFDRGAKARWLLTEMGVKFEERWLDRDAKENESPAFLKMNPMGRVPVAEIGDQVMFESGAICAHLADLHLDKGLAPAISAPERADYQKWMYFAASVDSIQGRIMVIEDIPPGDVQKTKEKNLQEELQGYCEALDQALSKGSFLVANRFSAADICVSYQLFWLRLWPELKSVMDAFPRVGAFIDRLAARPAALSTKAFAYEG
jgi:glutathione S-transferase